MSSETLRVLYIVQVISEVCIAIGYFIGVVPFAYLWTCSWVVPLTVVSLIIAFVTNNKTRTFAIANFIISLVSFIPIVGTVTRIIGGVLSIINVRIILKQINTRY